MFPQLGAPLGFICSGGVFLLLSETLSDAQFFNFGWRIPFLASSLLVFMGLYVRLRIQETPAFQQAIEQQERVRMPMMSVLRDHPKALVLGPKLSVARSEERRGGKECGSTWRTRWSKDNEKKNN